ncbi:hypothetical protein QJS66_07805 [Kocuria rhizophila]|nr:hypothetical protein QJS66_07805 [Kocuria rhizophila]
MPGTEERMVLIPKPKTARIGGKDLVDGDISRGPARCSRDLPGARAAPRAWTTPRGSAPGVGPRPIGRLRVPRPGS